MGESEYFVEDNNNNNNNKEAKQEEWDCALLSAHGGSDPWSTLGPLLIVSIVSITGTPCFLFEQRESLFW